MGRVFLASVIVGAVCAMACTGGTPPKIAEPPAGAPPVAESVPVADGDPLANPKSSPDAVKAALTEQRASKDRAFKVYDQSPIPAAERATFTGLKYFPVDLAYRFTCTLKKCDTSDILKMPATKSGDIRSYRCAGILDFTVDGKPCSLMALKNADPKNPIESALLFVPFKDATTGTETYGAGRYIELTETASGVYVLDFNRAFNPFCAYNPDYSCPIPPQRNVLPVAIRAGEKRFHD